MVVRLPEMRDKSLSESDTRRTVRSGCDAPRSAVTLRSNRAGPGVIAGLLVAEPHWSPPGGAGPERAWHARPGLPAGPRAARQSRGAWRMPRLAARSQGT